MYVHVVITIVLIAFHPIYFLRLLVLSLHLGCLVTTAEAVDTPDTEAAGVAAAVGVRNCIGVAVSWTTSLLVSSRELLTSCKEAKMSTSSSKRMTCMDTQIQSLQPAFCPLHYVRMTDGLPYEQL